MIPGSDGLVQVELATVQDHVSNVTIGKMRMQFWRDAIKDIFNVNSLSGPLDPMQ